MEANTHSESGRSPVSAPSGRVSSMAERATRMWWLYVLLGVVSVGLGAVTLSSTVSAVSTLVVLFSLFLLYSGAAEVMIGTMSRMSWLAVIAGVASIAAGIVALAWPDITLFVLTLFVGWALISWGIYDIYQSFTNPMVRPRWVTLVLGIALTAIGVLALVRPDATIVVLAALVGVLFIVYGVFSFVSGLRLLDMRREMKRAEPGRTMTDEMSSRRAA